MLKGSFLSYITRGSEPIRNIRGKINRGHQTGVSDFEMQCILDEALSEAHRPDHPRYEEIRKLFK